MAPEIASSSEALLSPPPRIPFDVSAASAVQRATLDGPRKLSLGPVGWDELPIGTQVFQPFPCCGICPEGQPPSANAGRESRMSIRATAVLISGMTMSDPVRAGA